MAISIKTDPCIKTGSSNLVATVKINPGPITSWGAYNGLDPRSSTSFYFPGFSVSAPHYFKPAFAVYDNSYGGNYKLSCDANFVDYCVRLNTKIEYNKIGYEILWIPKTNNPEYRFDIMNCPQFETVISPALYPFICFLESSLGTQITKEFRYVLQQRLELFGQTVIHNHKQEKYYPF